MKCDCCPAWIDLGTYECPEYVCALMEDDEILDFKDGSIGCRRKSIAKINKELDKFHKAIADSW